MVAWSERALAALADADVRPLPQTTLELPPAQVELERSLFDATGARGMPVLHGIALGAACAHDLLPHAPVTLPEDEATLFAFSERDGAWYLKADGALLHREEGIFAASAVAEIERLVLQLDRLPIWLEAPDEHGETLATALGVPWLMEASDDARHAWADARYLVIGEAYRTCIWSSSFDAWAPILAACGEHGVPVRVRNPAPEIVDDGVTKLPSRAPEYASAATRIYCEPEALLEAYVHDETLLADAHHDRERTRVRMHAKASRSLPAKLSARAKAYADDTGLLRDPTRTCSASELSSEIERRGLDASDALSAFETDFGGLVRPHATDRSLMPELLWGLWQILNAPLEIRRRLEGDDEDDEVFVPRRWPQLGYRDEVLTLIGVEHHEQHLYIDTRGVIYRYIGMYDVFVALAGSARVFFEQKALHWDALRRIGDIADLRIDAAVGDALAKELEVAPVPEASDRVCRQWLSEGYWLWERSAHPPNSAATFIAARTPAGMVDAARRASALAPSSGLRLAVSQPGGQARYAALTAAKLPVRI
jgi:hypothetical protein